MSKNPFNPILKPKFDHYLYQNALRNAPQSGQNCHKKPYKKYFCSFNRPDNFTQGRTYHEKLVYRKKYGCKQKNFFSIGLYVIG